MIERMICVTVSSELTEVVTDRMWRWGVRGIEEQTGDDDGRVTLSTSVGNDGAAISEALGTLDPSWTWRVDEVDATAADHWRRRVRPVRCRRDLVIAPAWWNEPLEADHATIVVRIEPGAAFGLGDHPTTRSSLRSLADEIDRRQAIGRSPRSLLDVGCGTGALAIYGACRDVASIRAVDIAAAAVAATQDNAERNHVAGRVVVDTTPLAALPIPDPDGYDIIVANILAPVLVALAEDLRRLLAPGGTLIISGVLSHDNAHGHHHVLEALAPLRAVSTIDDDGWATVTLTD